MINKNEMMPILAKIDNKVDANLNKDLKILQENITLRVLNSLKENEEIPEHLEWVIRQTAHETLLACHSVCINHDAAVINAVLEHIRKSL